MLHFEREHAVDTLTQQIQLASDHSIGHRRDNRDRCHQREQLQVVTLAQFTFQCRQTYRYLQLCPQAFFDKPAYDGRAFALRITCAELPLQQRLVLPAHIQGPATPRKGLDTEPQHGAMGIREHPFATGQWPGLGYVIIVQRRRQQALPRHTRPLGPVEFLCDRGVIHLFGDRHSAVAHISIGHPCFAQGGQ
ncbi:hypothetical protein STW0522PSE72_11110 [Pseudomonas monteilii]|nr:hypothetical protein STW0522PSE72_11110 [Pseudomonas monteilii]